MTNLTTRASVENSVDHINDQMDSNPHYPFNLQSEWLPRPDSKSIQLFFERVLGAEPKAYHPSIEQLDQLISSNEILSYLVDTATRENDNIITSNLKAAEAVNLPRIASKDDLLNAFNTILDQPPQFIESELVGLPFSALVVGLDPTLSGVTLFGLPIFNKQLGNVLNAWNKFLASEASNWIFCEDGKQWLSSAAKKQYQFEVWAKDNETLPYWNSWNSFFTRQFKDPEHSRPIASPDDNRIVNSANDGSLFRWDENISPKDVFWFKDMKYSLADIFSSEKQEDQEKMDQHNLVELFSDGSIFQTYLNPYNYHRWWCPVNGKVLFDPIDIPGAFFNKLVIPDFAGATTASLPYLVQVNARGLIVFQTEEHGYVCCIPLGMSEVSSICFNDKMKANNTVHKGQEMGMFEYGGSSYVMIFQKLPGKRLIFQNSAGDVYAKRPVLPKGSASTGGNITLIGSQIGKWETVDFNVDAKLPWQNTGYVNTGKAYSIDYVGGLWTANPEVNDGNLYGPEGSNIVAQQPGYAMPGANEGALVGRIGNNAPFLVGHGTQTPPGQTGPLLLCINDDLKSQYGVGLKDNEGQMTVSITPA